MKSLSPDLNTNLELLGMPSLRRIHDVVGEDRVRAPISEAWPASLSGQMKLLALAPDWSRYGWHVDPLAQLAPPEGPK